MSLFPSFVNDFERLDDYFLKIFFVSRNLTSDSYYVNNLSYAIVAQIYL